MLPFVCISVADDLIVQSEKGWHDGRVYFPTLSYLQLMMVITDRFAGLLARLLWYAVQLFPYLRATIQYSSSMQLDAVLVGLSRYAAFHDDCSREALLVGRTSRPDSNADQRHLPTVHAFLVKKPAVIRFGYAYLLRLLIADLTSLLR